MMHALDAVKLDKVEAQLSQANIVKNPSSEDNRYLEVQCSGE